jgi:hypothetical protein
VTRPMAKVESKSPRPVRAEPRPSTSFAFIPLISLLPSDSQSSIHTKGSKFLAASNESAICNGTSGTRR